ncbi:hypothetical protein H4R26_002526 [Coemansia thaxteri]|uniref:Zn(2)-C6 fungal-type domain-containing protein n=1 Tax=Coemansia thaxteri TaxID=2663907 RepID=A0A9W8BGD2_9FUNG|nr:hypothetical protein H4R26_002526 [Coemansia thaxteri]
MLRSCENCRRKKRKCSGNRPSCTRCKSQDEECVYRPTARFFRPMRHNSADGSSAVRRRPRVAAAAAAATTPIAKQRRPRALSAVASAIRRFQPEAGQGSLAPADLMLSSSSQLPPPPPLATAAFATTLSVTDGLAYMSAAASVDGADAGVTPTPYTSTSLSPPQMLLNTEFVFGGGPPPASSAPIMSVTAPSPLCDSDYTRLLLANAISRQQVTAAMMAAVAAAATAGGAPPMLYSPPLSASSFSTGISATPPLADSVPSPYSAPYPLCTPNAGYPQPALTVWPSPTDFVNSNLAPQPPMLPYQPQQFLANMAMAAAPPTAATNMPPPSVGDFVHAFLPQSKNTFPEWFA